jgi:hypothetical protein
MDTEGSFPGEKWTGREVDHSHPVNAEVRKTINPLPILFSGAVSN